MTITLYPVRNRPKDYIPSKLPVPPKQIKAEIIKWNTTPQLWSVYATVRRGSLETTNYRTCASAKRAFIAMCNRLGINRNIYYFEQRK